MSEKKIIRVEFNYETQLFDTGMPVRYAINGQKFAGEFKLIISRVVGSQFMRLTMDPISKTCRERNDKYEFEQLIPLANCRMILLGNVNDDDPK